MRVHHIWTKLLNKKNSCYEIAGKPTDETVATARQGSIGSLNASEPQKSLPPISFLKLCQQERFDEMFEILELEDEFNLEGWLFLETHKIPRNRTLFSWSWRNYHKTHHLHLFRGETPLHVAVHYSPTVAVVEKIIEILTKRSNVVVEDACDIMGKNSLHVAAATGCSVAVIGRLVSGVSAVMPAVAKDNMGRHALHWACTNPTGRAFVRRREQTEDEENSYHVIRLLLKTYPQARTIADDHGRTPFDIAKSNGASARIIELLEKGLEKEDSSEKKKRRGRETRRISNRKNSFVVELDTDGLEVNFQEDSTYFPDEVARFADEDEVSSIGTGGVSHINKKIFRKKARAMADTPWKNMTSIEEIIEYVERTAKVQNQPQQAKEVEFVAQEEVQLPIPQANTAAPVAQEEVQSPTPQPLSDQPLRARVIVQTKDGEGGLDGATFHTCATEEVNFSDPEPLFENFEH